MADNEIDTFEFILLNGAVPAMRQEIEQIRDPGFDGFERRRLGEQSPEFQLTSFVDMTSIANAYAEAEAYAALVNGPAVVLKKDNHDYNVTDDLKVIVAGVQPSLPTELAVICADRINNGDYALRAQWRLFLVRN